MTMLYLCLLLIAVIFAVFGYLMRAFYFEGARATLLTREIQALTAALEEKQREVGEARDEIAKAGELVHSLGQQVRHRNEEMQRLLRQAPRSNQHDALRDASGEPATGMAADPAVGASKQPAVDAPHPRGWRENLNSILDSLDTIEREVKK